MLIRYQVLPDTADPAHVARQLPPVTFVTAYTCVFAGRTAFRVALVRGETRNETPSHFVDLVDAPRACEGWTTDDENTIAAAMIATARRKNVLFGRRMGRVTVKHLCRVHDATSSCIGA